MSLRRMASCLTRARKRTPKCTKSWTAHRSDTPRKSGRRAKAVLTVEGKTVKADARNQGHVVQRLRGGGGLRGHRRRLQARGAHHQPRSGHNLQRASGEKSDKDEDAEDALIEAHTIVAALGLVPDIKDDLSLLPRSFPTSGSRSFGFQSRVSRMSGKRFIARSGR